jgi:magnesium-dependent phosphatase 1|uniref:Magnesium-dependent phosphatase-1 n=1 Tax=Picea sitchensis TaxID=3332 RepID=A9NR44_PICSI|nr:unknown [Picea sitchensis]
MADEQVKTEALQILNVCRILPGLIVFDLDYTLWPFYCECRSSRDKPSLYPQANGILNALKEKGVSMAIASRTPTPSIANAFLNKLGITSLFTAMEIYPSGTHKTQHFQKIQQKTGVPFKSMLFFDDENRNIEAVSNFGVTSILVGNGVNLDALKTGLRRYSGSSASQR